MIPGRMGTWYMGGTELRGLWGGKGGRVGVTRIPGSQLRAGVPAGCNLDQERWRGQGGVLPRVPEAELRRDSHTSWAFGKYLPS